MNFQELGELLRQEREAKGLTIEAVMEVTKISRINLVSIENGDSSTLPHPVYTKGFVKSYAKLLGLDADEMAMAVDREYRDKDHENEVAKYEVSPSAEKAFEGEMQPVRKRSVWPSILLVVVLASAAIALVLYLNRTNDESPVESAATVTEEQAPAAEAAPSTEESQSSDAESASEEPAVSDETAGAEEAAEKAVEQVEEATVEDGKKTEKVLESTTEEAAEKAEPVEAAEPVLPATTTPSQTETRDHVEDPGNLEEAKYAHVLVIRATTQKGCWIGLWKGDDTRMSRDFVLAKGEPLRLMFNNPRRIRIGNVAGVAVTYNGKPYKLEKNKTNIQTLTFGYN